MAPRRGQCRTSTVPHRPPGPRMAPAPHPSAGRRHGCAGHKPAPRTHAAEHQSPQPHLSRRCYSMVVRPPLTSAAAAPRLLAVDLAQGQPAPVVGRPDPWPRATAGRQRRRTSVRRTAAQEMPASPGCRSAPASTGSNHRRSGSGLAGFTGGRRVVGRGGPFQLPQRPHPPGEEDEVAPSPPSLQAARASGCRLRRRRGGAAPVRECGGGGALFPLVPLTRERRGGSSVCDNTKTSDLKI
jgi:hypothetical protein